LFDESADETIAITGLSTLIGWWSITNMIKLH